MEPEYAARALLPNLLKNILLFTKSDSVKAFVIGELSALEVHPHVSTTAQPGAFQELLQQTSPETVLIDCESGYKVCEELLLHARRYNPAVVCLLVFEGNHKQPDWLFQLPADACLPLSSARVLVAKLQQLLQRQRQVQQLAIDTFRKIQHTDKHTSALQQARMLDNISDAVAFFLPNGKIDAWNEVYNNFSRKFLLQLPDRTRVLADDLAVRTHLLETSELFRKGGEGKKIETEVLLKDLESNAPHYFKFQSMPVWERGNCLGHLVIFADVTSYRSVQQELSALNNQLEDRIAEGTRELLETNACLQEEVARRRQAEEELARANRLLQGVLDASKNYICYCRAVEDNSSREPRMELVLLNTEARNALVEQVYEIFGDDEAVGATCRFLKARLREVIATGKDAAFDVYGATDFLKKPAWLHITAVKHGENGVVATFSDVTRRIKIEKSLKEANEALARNAKMLKKANTELNVINEELSAFTYSVTHDLRAPLRSIKAFSDIIANDYGHNLEPEARMYFGRIQRNVQKINNLITDLYKLFKVTNQPLNYQQTDFSSMATETLQDYLVQLKDRKVESHIEPGISVVADSRFCSMLLQNLLENAIKYTSRNEKAIIEVGSKQHKGQTIYFVADNGTGFEQQFADKIFAPFQRLHSEEEFEGTGIGLAIVQRIVHKHGGRIWAEGIPDQGARFYFTFGHH